MSEKIEQELKEDIVSGKLKAGQKISIAELKERWGASSTPVRDAIKSLEKKGFLEVAPRESILVVTMDRQMFKEVFEIRIALESMVVELATPLIPLERIDKTIEECRLAGRKFNETKEIDFLRPVDFLVHQLVLDHCGNKRLARLAHEYRDLFAWVRTIVISQPHSMEFAQPEHLHILNSIRRRQIMDAQEAMRLHLINTYRRTAEAL